MIQMVKKASLVMMTLAMCCFTAAAGNNATKGKKAEAFNWNPIMDAIIQVESEGNSNAVSGNSVGVMQITPILVRECNDILEKMKSKKRFTMNDRFSVSKSKEMFLLIQSYHNPTNSIEKAIRSWNGGMRYSVRATNRYYKKVMSRILNYTNPAVSQS